MPKTFFDLNRRPAEFPDAMARATRIGFMHAMEQKPKVRAIRAVADLISPNCANGFATPIKQAYNAGYWAGEFASQKA